MFGGTIYDKPNTLIRKTMQRSTNVDSHLPHCFFFLSKHIFCLPTERIIAEDERKQKEKHVGYTNCFVSNTVKTDIGIENSLWKFSLLSKSHSISFSHLFKTFCYAILPVVRATVFNYSLSNKMCNKSFIIYYTMWIKQ